MNEYRVIYWMGSMRTERIISATTEDEAVEKLSKNKEDLVKIEQIEKQ